MAMSKALLLALVSAMPAHASLCPGANSWLNPATGETGACIAAMKNGATTAPYSFHCPWESAGSVGAYGCGKIKYDCSLSEMLTDYYKSGPAKEWGEPNKAYVLRCIAFQCVPGSADPGPGCAPSGRGASGDTCTGRRRLVTV